MDLDIFVSEDGENYLRMEDHFAERAYSEEQIGEALRKAGLEIQTIYGEDTFEPPREDEQRLIYVVKHCKKKWLLYYTNKRLLTTLNSLL